MAVMGVRPTYGSSVHKKSEPTWYDAWDDILTIDSDFRFFFSFFG